MDAIKFIEERNRMCKSFNSLECKGCPAFNAYELSCAVGQESTMNATDQIAIVEKWSTAHPRKTRQDVFLKLFPEADVCKTDGCLTLNPCEFYQKMYKECSAKSHCSECRHKFWMQEVE